MADRHILVVEDDAMVAWDIENVLLDAGCSVIGPVGGLTRALELVEAADIDIVVLDLSLGKETSLPIADRLDDIGIPFIFLSGHGRDFLPQRHRERPLVSKPFHSTLLLIALRDAMSAPGL